MKALKNSELNRLSQKEFQEVNKIPLIILLDNIRSAYNVGSAFRNADAFLVEKIILCGITAAGDHKSVEKTALGAQNTVKWEYYKQTKEAIDIYKELGYEILAIEQTTASVCLRKFKIDKNKKYLAVFGHELNGVDEKILELCKYSVEIPQFGTKHSLNVSVAIGIIVWEFNKALHN